MADHGRSKKQQKKPFYINLFYKYSPVTFNSDILIYFDYYLEYVVFSGKK